MNSLSQFEIDVFSIPLYVKHPKYYFTDIIAFAYACLSGL